VIESRYKIERHKNGFTVSGRDRVPVRVILVNGTGFDVQDDIRFDGNSVPFVGLFEFYRMHQMICLKLMRRWRAKGCSEYSTKGYAIKSWATQNTQRALGKRIHAEWKRMLAKVDSDVLLAQKKLYAVSMSCPRVAKSPEFYANTYLVRDVIKYRAAAASVALTCYGIPDDGDWMNRFTHHRDGVKYRSLRRTLMNLPGGMPVGVYDNLRYVRLERPITDRLELQTLLQYVGAEYGDNTNTHTMQHAKNKDIRRAVQIFSEHYNVPFSHRRAKDIGDIVRFLADYPEERPNIISLARATLEWHDNINTQSWCTQEYAPDSQVIMPPIDLPPTENIKFLETVSEIHGEGKKMGTCVGAYASKAMAGHCYLFHVEYKGETATVEVLSDGTISQSYGPRNRRNAASEWGRKMLNKWAKGISKKGEHMLAHSA
jgi:hypothetical protein